MTRYSGVIGLRGDVVETSPGIFSHPISDLSVQGFIRPARLNHSVGELSQDSQRANHTISVIIPESTLIDFSEVAYATWQGRKWTVRSIEYKRPRLELTLGGLWNEHR